MPALIMLSLLLLLLRLTPPLLLLLLNSPHVYAPPDPSNPLVGLKANPPQSHAHTPSPTSRSLPHYSRAARPLAPLQAVGWGSRRADAGTTCGRGKNTAWKQQQGWFMTGGGEGGTRTSNYCYHYDSLYCFYQYRQTCALRRPCPKNRRWPRK